MKLPTLFPRSLQPWSARLFRRPSAEYRGVPFWAWNDRLQLGSLKRQIRRFQRMGFGGFHMHSRTGLKTPFLGAEFRSALRACTREARRAGMFAWVYDEDRWPSGYAGGMVTARPEHQVKNLLFTREPYGKGERATPNVSYVKVGRTERGKLLARYAVVQRDGILLRYRRLRDGEWAARSETEWYLYLETPLGTPWFNGHTYLDTLSSHAAECFIASVYEVIARTLGKEFGQTVPAIFTDEPQHVPREHFTTLAADHDLTLPVTDDFCATFQAAYRCDLLDKFPEVVWQLPGGVASVVRYCYHEHVTARFAKGYAAVLSRWCRRHGVRLTGHMMEEPTLASQTRAVGEVMQSLAYFDIPGVDLLCDREELNTLKQAQSIARQYGREGVMTELYGATGWHFDFVGHKAQGDWQAALGATFRVPHLAWSSMQGEAKRDYPASISWHAPWWKEYTLVENHFARVNTVMTRGVPVVSIAVVHPVESCWLNWGPSAHTKTARSEIEAHFAAIPEWFAAAQLDFDYLSESLLTEQPVACARGRLRVGAAEYGAIVVPPVATIRRSTLVLLRRFAASGGVVIVGGHFPLTIQGSSPRGLDHALRGAIRVEWRPEALMRVLERWRDFECQNSDGSRTTTLLFQFRREGRLRHLFLCNRLRADGVTATLKMPGLWRVTSHDTIAGRSREIRVEQIDGQTRLPLHLEPHGHALFTFEPGSSRKLPPRRSVRFTSDGITLEGPVPISLSEPNVLLLSQAEWRWNGGSWQEKEELLRLTNLLRFRCGLPAHDGHAIQPWADLTPAQKLGRLELRFEIESDCAIAGAKLATERPNDCQVFVGGAAVNAAACGHWVDDAIRCLAIPRLRAGTTELRVCMDFTSRTTLEWLYLLGDFGVYVEGRTAHLSKSIRKLQIGDWTQQGLPFYAGNVTYHFAFTAHAGGVEVSFPRFSNPLLKVRLDKRIPQRVAFAPFAAQFARVAAGKHRLDVAAFGNRANAFGPVHHTDLQLARCGPSAWRSTGADWSYSYKLRAMGLLAGPVLRANRGE